MKKIKPTCWIKQAMTPGDYRVYRLKPRWLRVVGAMHMEWLPAIGLAVGNIGGQSLSALIGDEWELPKEGELLEVEDGTPTWMWFERNKN